MQKVGGEHTAAREKEGKGRWAGVLWRSLCRDCVSLRAWIRDVTRVAWCCARGRECKMPVRGDEITSRGTSSERQRRQALV